MRNRNLAEKKDLPPGGNNHRQFWGSVQNKGSHTRVVLSPARLNETYHLKGRKTHQRRVVIVRAWVLRTSLVQIVSANIPFWRENIFLNSR